MQPGDVAETTADIEASKAALGFSPKMPLREGIRNFLSWYKRFYEIGD
jgi:UDP-glucuronate 4-epimerase